MHRGRDDQRAYDDRRTVGRVTRDAGERQDFALDDL
jgi:hypothetical protein